MRRASSLFLLLKHERSPYHVSCFFHIKLPSRIGGFVEHNYANVLVCLKHHAHVLSFPCIKRRWGEYTGYRGSCDRHLTLEIVSNRPFPTWLLCTYHPSNLPQSTAPSKVQAEYPCPRHLYFQRSFGCSRGIRRLFPKLRHYVVLVRISMHISFVGAMVIGQGTRPGKRT